MNPRHLILSANTRSSNSKNICLMLSVWHKALRNVLNITRLITSLCHETGQSLSHFHFLQTKCLLLSEMSSVGTDKISWTTLRPSQPGLQWGSRDQCWSPGSSMLIRWSLYNSTWDLNILFLCAFRKPNIKVLKYFLKQHWRVKLKKG